MHFLDLPNEILLKIYEHGGTDILLGGASQSCKRLREVSDDPELWQSCLAPHFKMHYLTPAQIDFIPNYREWCLKQRENTRRTLEALDVLVSEMRDASPEDIEVYTWQILKLRLGATEGLNIAKRSPRTISHYHWAHWLTEIMYRLEGVHMLLKLSTTDDWGNGVVERPIEQIIALYTLRNGKFPVEVFNELHFSNWQPSSLDDENSELTIYEVASELAQHVFQVFSNVTTRNDFLSVLGRGALFIELAYPIAEKVGWQTSLIKMPMGSYVCIQPKNSEVFFVDFQREGKLRSLDDVKQRLNLVGATGSVHTGISLYDTLSTSYVWHTAPTQTRHCVLDLIEHAVHDVKVTHLAHAPRLYINLAQRIIKRNISEVETAPLSRIVSSASLASVFGTNPGGWLRKGKVVRILAGDTESPDRQSSNDTQEDDSQSDAESHTGVVLEVTDGSVLVLKGSEIIRVIKQMLQPTKTITMTTVAGLRIPDIGVDVCFLGQYFMRYNVNSERFE